MVVYHSAQLVETGSNVNAVVDIIYISNLTSHILKAWKGFGDTGWFEDRLSQRSLVARTFLYRYQGRHATLADTVTDAATQLLAEWDRLNASESWGILRDSILGNVVEQPSRPVIFVCHGLGGLVVKKALLWAEAQRETPHMLRRTFGFIFIGTPHASEFQTLAQTQKRDLSVRDGSNSELEAIGLEHLSQISLAFPRVGELYMSVNFCESSCFGTRVLHPDCLWAMFSQCQISQYEDKHWDISEHSSPDIMGSNIERCMNYMIEAAARVSQNSHELLASGQAAKDKYSMECLDNTGEWLLALDSYRSWTGAGEPCLLWLHGSPGAGKSTLCSALIDALRSCCKENDLVIYCFLEDAPGQPDAAEYILRTITYRLRQHHHPLVPDYILRSVLKAIQSETDGVTSEIFQRQLRGILRAIDSQAQISLVIDGIGSADGTSSIVVDEILRANLSRRSSKRLRCAMSTRASFQAACHKGSYLEIDLSNEPAVQRDLKAFAVARLIKHPPPTLFPENPSIESLAGQLYSRANGSFLWIALAAETLQQEQSQVLEPKRIESLPSTVEALYQMELANIPASDVRIAQSVFSWLTVTKRALHFTELLDALTVTIDTHQSNGCAGSPVTTNVAPRSDKRLIQICRRLVVVNDAGYVNFRHSSVRRYLLCSTWQKSAEHAIFQAHEHVARTCLMLLNSKDRTTPSIFCIDSPPAYTKDGGHSLRLQDYAAANWSFHYRFAESHSKILAGTLQHCIFQTLDCACDFFSISRTSRSVQIATTTLRICAHYGLSSLTQICLEMGVDPNEGACHYCETPLAIAAAGGHAPVATLLLRNANLGTANIRYESEGILHLAAAHGYLEITELLLARGGDANASDPRSGRRPLHNAAASGHLSLVKLLMAHGVDINAVTPDTQETPLHLAALHGHVAVVKYLLDGQEASSKEVELYDRIIEQPYFQAWTEHVLEIDSDFEKLSCETTRPIAGEYFKELLSCSQRYTDIDMQTREGWTAVHLAASKGHEAIVGLLLERGATLQVTGDTTCTALQIAAEYGQLMTVKLLLAAGASLSGGSERIGSILGRIKANGHHVIVEILLWHAFVSKIHGNARNWPLLSLAMKSKHVSKHGAMPKRQFQKQKSTERTLRFKYSADICERLKMSNQR